MNFDLTITISVTIALCAIISPILVAIINNIHQTKMKKLEILTDYKLKAIENYMQCLGQCRKDQFGPAINNYAESYGHAIIYVSKHSRQLMSEIDSLIDCNNLRGAKTGIDVPPKTFDDLCVSLNNDLRIKKYSL